MTQEQSVFVGSSSKHEVHDVPVSVICRPIPSVLDEEKVREEDEQAQAINHPQ